MIKRPSYLGIKARILALVLVPCFSIAALYILTARSVSETLTDIRFEQAQSSARSAIALLDVAEGEGKKKNTSLAQRQVSALDYLRALNEGKSGYYWIVNDEGLMVLHPDIRMQGKSVYDLDDRMSKEWKKMIVTFAKTGAEQFVTYDYGTSTTQDMLKVAYIKRYPAWGWVVARSIYVADIESDVQKFLTRFIFLSSITGLLALALAYLVGRSISIPVLSLNRAIQRVAAGDTSGEIKERFYNDEIGEMAKSVQMFIENERRIAMLEDEQKGSENLQKEFVSIVSHELRTPLTSIRGALGLLAKGMEGDVSPKAQHLVSIALTNCERLAALVNDILDIDKIEEGSMRFDLKPESVNHLVHEAVEANRDYARRYSVKIKETPLEPDAFIVVDEARFQQIMANLLSNAAKYSLSGTKVDVGAHLGKKHVRISVRDYGVGIPENFKPRIFKKFSQANAPQAGKKRGTGLGLYICKQLVDQMNGAIGYESTSGEGALFWVDFPLLGQGGNDETVKENVESKKEEAVMPILQETARRVRVVLHVDSDVSFSKYFAALLGETHSVTHVRSVAEALDYLTTDPEANACTSIVVDPDLKDKGDMPKLMAIALENDIPVIALSAQDPAFDVREHARSVLIKSLATEEEIIAAVDRAQKLYEANRHA